MLLTERYQQQLIRDFIDGLDPATEDIGHLTDPYDWLYDYLSEAPNTDRRYILFSQLVHQDDEWRSIVESTLALTPGQKDRFKTIEQVGSERPVTTWLWENWIPKGYLSMLAGYPSAGKTYFSLDFIRLVAMGLTAPDGEPFVDLSTQTTIFVDGEDFAAEAWRRLSAWEFDPIRMFVYEKPKDDMIDFTRPEHKDDLRQMCYTLKPDLIIVDSLSTVSPNGENSVEDVRTLLSFLISIAQDYNCAVCLLHHLSKPKKGTTGARLTMHDLRGSSHIVAMARCIIGLDNLNLGSDDPNGPKIIKSLKNNLGKIPFPIRLDFEQNQANPKLADLRYSSMDLFSRPDDIKSESQRCAEWLVDLLETEGPMSYTDIVLEADHEGFSRYAVGKAREALGGRIIDTAGAGVTGNKWAVSDGDSSVDDFALTKADACARWLLDLLDEHGELPLTDIKELAAERDFSIGVVLRARDTLGVQIVDTKGAKVRGNKWTLAPWGKEESEAP